MLQTFMKHTTFAHFCHAFVTRSGTSRHAEKQSARLELVTHLSPLGALKVRFAFAAPSPQITDLKIAMHTASHVFYQLGRKK